MTSTAQQTANYLRLRRSLGLRDRRRRLPRQLYPKTVEREYVRRLYSLIDEMESVVASGMPEILRLLEFARAERLRQDAGEGRRTAELAEQMAAKLKALAQPGKVLRLAQEFAERTSTAQRLEIQKQTKAALGVDIFVSDRRIPPLIEGFVAENAALITNIPAKTADEIAQTITRAYSNATTVQDLQKEIEHRFKLTRDRARLIARDQIGKLNGQVNEARQKELGVTRYIWRTVKDERVRGDPDGKYPRAEPSHFDREGQTFSYDDPPEGGHPGQDYQCRCYAEPVYSDILGLV